MSDMFCFQCEQTAGGKVCATKGVCGKAAPTSNLQDELTGAMVGLSRAVYGQHLSDEVTQLLLEGLFTTVTNVSFDDAAIQKQIEKTRRLKTTLDVSVPEYNMAHLWNAHEDIRSLKSLILFGIRGMAAYAYHAWVLGYKNDTVNRFFVKALVAIGGESDADKLLALVMETGSVNLECMALLDKANTETYGDPIPTTVPLSIEAGPFIVVSGHDLYDLHKLLEQTKDKGVNVYTHGEMLPAHAYPKLKAYPHLKGNFGTAWQNQQKEFANLPGPVLFTTNCIMPVKDSYADRIFTTEVVAYPGMVNIGDYKNFTRVI